MVYLITFLRINYQEQRMTITILVVSTILFSNLFVSFSYCGVCSTRLLSNCLSIYDVIVIEKKVQMEKESSPSMGGATLSSHSVCKFTIISWRLLFLSGRVSMNCNFYYLCNFPCLYQWQIMFASLTSYSSMFKQVTYLVSGKTIVVYIVLKCASLYLSQK